MNDAEILSQQSRPSRRVGRSIWAVVAGLLAVVILSVGTDELLRMIEVFPPSSQRMSDKLFLLATLYRTCYGVVGGSISARLAPYRSMAHALILGAIGFALGLLGFIVTRNAGPELGPRWYPIAIIAIALPTAWLGGKLAAAKTHTRRAS